MTSILEQLRAALPVAMRARDTAAVAALRGAIAAVGNAEAVDASDHAHVASTSTVTSEHVAGANVGLGSADVARRALSEDDVHRVVQAEIDSRLADAVLLEAHDHGERAQRLRAEAAVLHGLLEGTA
jgi:uncharacterized protein